MKKIFAAILFWWNYVVLKKERSELTTVYGKAVNKKGNIYYYCDTFQTDYVGTKVVKHVRTNRTFVKQSEYLAHMYNS